MKALLVILTATVLSSCAQQSYPVEDRLYQTKYYVGRYILSEAHPGCMVVLTTDRCLTLKDSVDIPDSSLCYVRVERHAYDFHPDIAYKVERQFFSWPGSDQEYLLHNPIKLK